MAINVITFFAGCSCRRSRSASTAEVLSILLFFGSVDSFEVGDKGGDDVRLTGDAISRGVDDNRDSLSSFSMRKETSAIVLVMDCIKSKTRDVRSSRGGLCRGPLGLRDGLPGGEGFLTTSA